MLYYLIIVISFGFLSTCFFISILIIDYIDKIVEPTDFNTNGPDRPEYYYLLTEDQPEITAFVIFFRLF